MSKEKYRPEGVYSHPGAWDSIEHLANVKIVNPETYDSKGKLPLPVITKCTHGTLYIEATEERYERYTKRAEELWNDIIKMCELLTGVKKKLANTNFVERAKPEIVQKEREKKEYYDNQITQMYLALSEMEKYIAKHESKTRI